MDISATTIAIADDHTAVRKGFVSMLKELGLKVIHDEANGRDLIEKIESTGLIPDVCLMDINMPVMNGYEATLVLKDKWPEIRVIGLSAYNSEFNVIKMLRNGAGAYLSKLASPFEIQAAIKAVMTDDVYYSGIVSGKMISQLRNPEADPKLALTDLELDFMARCASDLTYRQIAEDMDIPERALEAMRESLFQRLGINYRSGLVSLARSMGLLN